MRQLLLIFLFLGPPLLTAQTPDRVDAAGFDPARLERLDAWLHGIVADGTVPNVQALVLRRGREVFRATHGYANLERRTPARPDHIYRIASQTKALVTVGLMMEYEKGKFLLDDPVSDYLPAFAAVRVLKAYDAESGTYTTEAPRRPVTIRHLLSHSSGLSYELPFGEPADLAVPFFASLKDDTAAAVADRIARRPLLHHPGEGFTYGLSTDVAGRLLEVISGKSLEAYLTDHLWTPLEMADSHFYLPAEKHDRLVTLYSKHDPTGPLTLHENETYRDFPLRGARTYFSGGAGSVGTIADYGKFCQMMRNGGKANGHRFLAPGTVRMMLRNQLGPAEVWNRKDHFGLGFQLIGQDGVYADQATPGSFTWGGMYLSEYTIDPAEELTMLIYTNVHPIAAYSEVVRKFRVLVYAALVE